MSDIKENIKGNCVVLKRDKTKCINYKGLDGTALTHKIIEGENLYALAELVRIHREQIDVIYIDPPYNTGNKDFIYNDKFVDKEDGFRHTKWRSFMTRRIQLARDLLKDSGVIFISIDDNEQAHLRIICDEIFGEDNFIANIVNESSPGGKNDARFIKITHEYILVYAKNRECCILNKKISIRQNDLLQPLEKMGDHNKRSDRPNLYFQIYYNPSSKQIYTEIPNINQIQNAINKVRCVEILPRNTPDGENGCWRWSKSKVEKDKNKLVVKMDNYSQYRIYTKNEAGTEKSEPFTSTIQIPNSRGTKDIFDLLGDKPFSYPKPVSLIKHLLQIASQKDSIILDFFAGSGTTGQAVLELNKEDGGSRQFVLVNNNENNICSDITYPRIRKVMEKIGCKDSLVYAQVDVDNEADIHNCWDTEKLRELSQKMIDNLTIQYDTYDEARYKDDQEKRWRVFWNKKTGTLLGIIFNFYHARDFLDLLHQVKGMKNYHIYILSYTEDCPSIKDIEDSELENFCEVTAYPRQVFNAYCWSFTNEVEK